MTSLTETAYHTRRAINWIILSVIGYFILKVVWSISVIIYLVLFPPKPPPPNHAFGPLPKLQFPTQIDQPTEPLTFRLETIEGKVPQASESAAVYFMPKKAANLLALSRTQTFVERLGFSKDPIQESTQIYRFQDPAEQLRSIRFDIISGNFVLRYLFEKDTSLFLESNLPSDIIAENEAKDMLQTHNLYTSDLLTGKHKISYLKMQGEEFVQSSSLSRADAIRVDFFRGSISGLPVVTPIPNEGHVAIIFSGSSNPKKRLLQFAYTFWPVDINNVATYELKPSSVAWQELQSGGGYIARYPETGNEAIVRNIYLAYYDSFEPQTYLQPIYVFEGDNGFAGYVHALPQTWVEQDNP